MYVRLRDTGMNNREIAEQLDVDEASVRRGLAKAQYRPHQLPDWFINEMAVYLDKPLEIDLADRGPGAVTADWHLPLTDYDLVNTFLDHALDIGATNWLLVAGDWFNADFWSQFDNKQTEAGVLNELRGSTETMRRVLEVFDEVVLTWGNHDSRMHKVLKYAVDFKQTMKWLFSDLSGELQQRIRISNLDYALIHTPQGTYRACHPKVYSQVPLTQAIRLASKHLTHIITGHSHHSAIGYDRSGKFTVAEIGGFFDASKVQYLQRTTAFPEWTPGYGFIDRDGYLIVESKNWSTRIGRRA